MQELVIDIGIEECETTIDSIGNAILLAYAEDSGPYVIRIGAVPVGAFGFATMTESEGRPDKTKQLLDSHAFEIATIAFNMIRQKLSVSDDPSKIRDMARAACKHARLRFLTSNRQMEHDRRRR